MENQIETPKTKKSNAWLEYVKGVKKDNPDKSFKEVLQLAKSTYKPIEKPVKVKKSKSQKDKDDE